MLWDGALDDASSVPLPSNSQNSTVISLSCVPPVRPLSLSRNTTSERTIPVAPL
jgi:hypothetical protein